jgi:predicted O-methyltransferase YrrM
MKRIAADGLTRVVRPLRAIKPVDRLVSVAFQVWFELPVPPAHFYSPLPDMSALERNRHRWYREDRLDGMHMDLDRQRAFLKSLVPFRAECDQLLSEEEVTAQGYGLGYGAVEASFLHGMIRRFKPRRMIEVGSGVSTYFALHALEMNRRQDGVDSTLTCIEPYPKPKLRQWVAEKKVTAYLQQVQDTDCQLFDQLEDGDFLFIDSSHTSKVDSDVNFLYFDILPLLRQGVIVHIHDIPFPHLTCPPGHPMYEKSLLWNEAALLRAFLIGNTTFEVLVCQSYLHLTSPQSLQQVVSFYDPEKHFPTSFWMRKIADGAHESHPGPQLLSASRR